jgi:L-lactate dehydrogenase (cytochrome)
VGDRIAVWFDGGIRSGQSLLKALALGAQAVLLGRAFVYGLGAKGEAGVLEALQVIQKELDVTMALTGMRDVKDASPEILRGV